jgi:hypothetical protein
MSERPGVVPGVRAAGAVALVPPPPGDPPALPVLPLPELLCARAAQDIDVANTIVVKSLNMMPPSC